MILNSIIMTIVIDDGVIVMNRYRQLATTTTATVTKANRQRIRLECTRYITIHSISSSNDDGDDDDDDDKIT